MVYLMIVFLVLSRSAVEVFLSARTPSVAFSISRLARSIPCAVAQHRDSSIRSIPSKSSPHHDLRTPARNGDSPTSLFSSPYALFPSQTGVFNSVPIYVSFCYITLSVLSMRSAGKTLFFPGRSLSGGRSQKSGLGPEVGSRSQGSGGRSFSSDIRITRSMGFSP